MFKQLIKDGYQAEVPDVWLEQGNPWEIKRHDIRFQVGFSGKTVTDKGKTTWIPGEKVRGVVGRLRWHEQQHVGWYVPIQGAGCGCVCATAQHLQLCAWNDSRPICTMFPPYNQ